MGNTNMAAVDSGQIISDVTTNLIKEAISSGWEKVKKYFKDLDAKESIKYGAAYFKYLSNTEDKYGKIKTIIYRRMPKELYSFFECTDVEHEGKRISTENVKNILGLSNKVIVSGTGGIGKSILFKHLFLNTIRTTDYIPVLIELRKFNSYEIKDISLADAVYQSLYENGFQLAREYFDYSMEKGGYVILLDGFDEVSRDKAQKITSEIKALSDKYSDNNYILSSRPTDSFIGWNDFTEVSACKLTKEQALSLINKIDFDTSVKTVFYKALDEKLFDKYESFASNPLLLTIMLLTFSNHASIPDKLNDFYEEAFSTLFNMHDATKDCYVRDIRSKLGSEDFKNVFAYICFKSYFSSEFEFSETRLRKYIQLAKEKYSNLQFSVDDFQEDLILSVCMLVKDGLNYRFTHRSFQEYFAAWHTCKITDDQQSKLLTAWMAESDAPITDEYLSMLFNMQSEKVNKVILSPGIQKIREIYNQNGFSTKFLESLFSGIRVVHRMVPDGKEHKALSLIVSDMYLCNILRCTCRCNSYTYGQQSNEDLVFENSIANKLIKNMKGKSKTRVFSFDEVTGIVGEADMLKALSWFEKQYEFCVMIFEQNSRKGFAHKKKVASIIEEL